MSFLDGLKPYLYAGAAAVCMALGAFIVWSVLHTQLAASEEARKTAEARVEALTLAQQARDAGDAVRESQRASVTQRTKENHEALDAAVAASGDWGSVPVPDAVARVLRDAAAGAGTP